ncbi:MAG: Kelch repeat-containing protein, partial [Planctomyces sp.]
WSLTAPMKQPRWSLDAIALDNGRILFAGGSSGFTPDGSLASAEVFDPTQNSFQPTENDLSGARHSSGLSRLADGRILITGGCRLGNNLSGVGETAVDIYDPQTNRFTTAASMNLGRTLHGQVTLRDGRVLVVGGAQKDAEIYDPAANQWKSSVGQLPTTLKDMKLFELHDGRILIAGGQNTVDGLTTDNVWYFSTETTEFSPGPSMQGFNYSPEGVQVGVSDYSAFDLFPYPHALCGRYILFAGGENDPPTGPDVELHSSSVFDAISDRWIDLGPMAFIHDDHTESVLQISASGQPQVLLFGGNSTMGSSRFELYPTALGLDGNDKTEVTEPAKGE